MVYRKVWIHALTILLGMAVLAISGCDGDDEEDLNISEVTIYNIPAQIPVMEDDPENPGSKRPSPTNKNAIFKIYFNASDFTDDDKPPKACGLMKLDNSMKDGDTYTVKIPLQNPQFPFEGDPNEAGDGDFYGTANYFSIMIVPQNVTTDGADAIWIKGGLTLNKPKATINWNAGLTDFRGEDIFNQDFPGKTKALYDEIVCKDKDITHE